MSIINKMHQGLQERSEESPILSVMPVKKQKKRVLLLTVIGLLVLSSIALSYLIYQKQYAPRVNTQITPPMDAIVLKVLPIAVGTVTEEVAVAVFPEPVVSIENQVETGITSRLEPKVVTRKKPPAQKKSLSVPVRAEKIKTKVVQQEAKNENNLVIAKQSATRPHLEIKKSILTDAQLADIHLQNAQKALQEGDTPLVAQENTKALNLQPQLHQVRQSLALYYYSIGEKNRAKNLLKKGALQFPEHANFNLMLARIAMKNDDLQRAYLYLQQHPPKVEGNLDYHVSYAILAQKFKHYQQAENLYLGLLAQRPKNGRWRMSLAIIQDKLGKQGLAVATYQQALLQIDLSDKAKKYINQRLTYLENQ